MNIYLLIIYQVMIETKKLIRHVEKRNSIWQVDYSVYQSYILILH